MSRRTAAAALRWAVMGLSLLLILVALPYFSEQQNPTMGIAFVVYAAVGWLLTGQRPENPLGWLFLAITLLGGMVSFGNALSHLAFQQLIDQGARPPAMVAAPWWGWLGAWLNGWPYYVLITLMTSWTFLLFPSGLQSRRWRPVLGLSGLAIVVTTLLAVLAPVNQLGSDADLTAWCPGDAGAAACLSTPNPLSPSFMDGFVDLEGSAAFGILLVVFVAVLALSILSVILRFRRSTGVERLQMRWFALAAALVGIGFASQGVASLAGQWLADVLFAVLIALVPTACGIAILRYRLYDIDRIISRTASYATVTGLLSLTYVAIVTSVSTLVGEVSTLAVAGATLAAAALFRPLLARVQRVVDRRFNRDRVDHQRAVEEFASRLTNQVDPDRAPADLLDVTRRTLAPSSLRIWTVER